MRTFSIASGKGGVGKTTLAVNLAIALARQDQRVVVFDADLALANVDVLLGVQSEFNLQHVLAGEKTLKEILVDAPGGIRILTGGSGIRSLLGVGPKRMAIFQAQLEELAESTDVLLFDSGAGIHTKVMAFLKMSEQTLLVTTPDPAAVTDAYALLKTLYRTVPGAQVHVIVNMVASQSEGERVFQTIQSTAQQFLGTYPEYLGSVRQDSSVVAAGRMRQPFAVQNPTHACEDLYAIATKMHKMLSHHDELTTGLRHTA